MIFMKNKFEFKKEGHIYTLNGKRLTGITTILGVISKPALIGWSAKMSSEYVLNNLKDIKDLERVCEEAKTAHARKRDKAGDAGTDVHEIIEAEIKNAIENTEGFISPKWKEQYDGKQVINFLDWAVKNKVKFLESEKMVYSEKLFCAGTYDFKCEIDKKIYIGDIKTSSGIYDRTPFAQTAAYQMMELENEPNNQIDGRLIINIKKNGTFNEDKDVYSSEYYKEDLELFMSALSIYRLMNNTFEPMNSKKSITI